MLTARRACSALTLPLLVALLSACTAEAVRGDQTRPVSVPDHLFADDDLVGGQTSPPEDIGFVTANEMDDDGENVLGRIAV